MHLDEKSILKTLLPKIKFLAKAIQDYDLFHFYFGKSLLPLNLDMPILKLFNKKTIMHYVGTNIRIMRIARRENPNLIHRLPKSFLDRMDLLSKFGWCGKAYGLNAALQVRRSTFLRNHLSPPKKSIIQ